MNNRLYWCQHIRELERLAIISGITEYQLMLTAGKAAFTQCQANFPDAKRILICAGKGNNAGDGYVIARLAKEHDLDVTVLSLVAIEKLKGAALMAAQAAKKAGVMIQLYEVSCPLHADLIVDALLGTGVQGEVRKPYDTVIQAINASTTPVLSIDVPSGLDADTG